MDFFLTFLEGIISFISPCMLPMLPIYISYFAGGADKKHLVFVRALSFVLGFTTVYAAMGLGAGAISMVLMRYQTAVNIITGVIVIVFGLSYLEIINIPFFKGMKGKKNASNIFSAFLFGIVYSISLTPCVGAFLGSALMQAATSGTALRGTLLLVAYSLGLGIPFLISAVLIKELSGAFAFIKKHYRVINTVCGIFLIAVGLLMCTGLLNKILHLFL
ncbi:MAG: cytochrome c biogenesis protein CcdA [Ruminococcaceae bacterium]|nr:cytochrome c biogenesis protein CcdA [Oscillospiraceae bacterium]